MVIDENQQWGEVVMVIDENQQWGEVVMVVDENQQWGEVVMVIDDEQRAPPPRSLKLSSNYNNKKRLKHMAAIVSII